MVELDGIKLENLKYKKYIKDSETLELICKNVNSTREIIAEKTGLSKQKSYDIKNELFNYYENNIPDGYEEIKKYPEYIINKNSDIRYKRTRRQLKQRDNRYGYKTVCLHSDKAGYKISKPVHRLVDEQFIDNPENKKEVNHIDGNKINNNASNLEWCTRQENSDHASRSGLRNTIRKFTKEQIIEIRNRIDNGEGFRKVGREFNSPHPVIRKIYYRETYKEIE